MRRGAGFGYYFCCDCRCLRGLFYAFNLQTALIADDYNYRFIFGTANQRVEHIFDIIESMRAHYHTMNGRLILHSLTQLFLLWGKSCVQCGQYGGVSSLHS